MKLEMIKFNLGRRKITIFSGACFITNDTDLLHPIYFSKIRNLRVYTEVFDLVQVSSDWTGLSIQVAIKHEKE